MTMMRKMAIGLILWISFCLPGCGSAPGEKLTLETVRALAAEKGEALSWSDFERYPSVETGSGLYILVYEIDAAYRLMIGGTPGEAPLYIYLVSTGDMDRRVDIRYGGVDEFLNQSD